MRASLALAMMTLLVGCPASNRCKTGTLLIDIDRTGAAADGGTLRLDVSVDGGSPVRTDIPVSAGQSRGTVQVEFPAGYPEGATVSVTATSLSGATELASQTGSIRLAARCEALELRLGGAASDMTGQDLTPVPDFCGAMPTYCNAHGNCANTGTGPSCTCFTGYAGAQCSTCATGYQDNDGNGSCTPTCATAGQTCGGNGTCSDATGTPVCTCLPEFTGPNCDQCRGSTAKAIFLFNAAQVRVDQMNGRAGADLRVTTALPANLPGLPGATYRARAFISMTGDAMKDFPTRYCVPTGVPVNGFNPNGTQTELGANWLNFMDGTIPTTIGLALGYQDFNYFWTGSTNLGAATGHDCSGWTTTAGTDASISNRSNVTTDWLNSLDNAGCGSGYLLLGLAYCIANCP
jgi:hypothetical protein